MNVVRVIEERRELVANLVSRQLKSRYKGSALGFLWTLATPLFMALIYILFLRLLAGVRGGFAVQEIIIGVFAWQFTVQSVQGGLTCISGNANLVKKVYFPRVLLPLADTLANALSYLLSLVVQMVLLTVLLAMQGQSFPNTLPMIAVILVLHTALNFTLALVLGALNVYFRDTQHLVGVGLTAWFFLSPAMYSLSFVLDQAGELPRWALHLYLLNPMAGIITAYRAAILPAVDFPWTLSLLAGMLWPLLALPLALVGFQRAQRNFADML